MKMKDLKKHTKCSTSLHEPTLIGLYDLVTKSTAILYKILCLSEDFCTVIQANGNSTKHGEETRILFNQSQQLMTWKNEESQFWIGSGA